MLIRSVNPTAIGWPAHVYKTQTPEPEEADDQVFLGVCLTRVIQMGGPASVYILGIAFHI